MHLYRITNKLNGKKYIGITTRKNPQRRWSEHKSTAKKSKKSKTYINRALKKYGALNFDFEVIASFQWKSVKELLEEETKFILLENTLCPNGYNLKLEGEEIEITEDVKKRLSKNRQGKGSTNKTSNYLGVSKDGRLYRCEIAFRGEKHAKRFSCEIEAAKCYDMLAINFFGHEAIINFPTSSYSKEDIDSCVDSLNFKNREWHSSKYKNIFFCKERSAFRIKYKGYSGQASSEEEAKEMLDFYIKTGQKKLQEKTIKKKKEKEDQISEIKALISEGYDSKRKISQALSLPIHRIEYLFKFL